MVSILLAAGKDLTGWLLCMYQHKKAFKHAIFGERAPVGLYSF